MLEGMYIGPKRFISNGDQSQAYRLNATVRGKNSTRAVRSNTIDTMVGIFISIGRGKNIVGQITTWKP